MSDYSEMLNARIHELEEERDNLTESHVLLMEALAPFAAFWDVITPQEVTRGDDTPIYGRAGVEAGEVQFTTGDVRRAHAFLKEAEKV